LALDDLKNKFYDKSNIKNRNLIQLNIDKEFETEDFQDYVYDKINTKKNLDELMQKKKKNEMKIEQNKKLIKIDKFYPSSKTCFICGYVKEDLKLSDRFWTCPYCGETHDRDYNAAINIHMRGMRKVVYSD
jgi:transposase